MNGTESSKCEADVKRGQLRVIMLQQKHLNVQLDSRLCYCILLVSAEKKQQLLVD